MTTATEHVASRACYLRGCRKPGCVEENKRYCKRYRLTRHTTGRRRVDAAPYATVVRRYTEAGWSHSEIAALAGCSETVINDLSNGAIRIHATTAARVASMPQDPELHGGAAYLNAVGTTRRLRALCRAGRSVGQLADTLDLHPDHVSRLLHGRHSRVLSATHVKVKNLFEAWQSQPGPSELSAQRAAQFGWRDPQWWEDYGHIDDPDFDPDQADRVLNFHERARLRREEIEHLAWCGHEPEQILDRLNGEVSISTVRQIVQEWRTGQKRQRKQVAA